MADKKNLVLIGAGGTCKDVLQIIASINQITPKYNVLGLLDDNLAVGTKRFGEKVLGKLSHATQLRDVKFVDCLGSAKSYTLREEILSNSGLLEFQFETIIHMSAFIADSAKIGEGCIIFPNVVLLADVKLGKHITVLTGCILNHDVGVDDWSILASGVNISGAVNIESSCYVGAGSCIKENISIAAGSLVGMGSVVTRDIDTKMIVTGVPAKPLEIIK